jgi:hypothetical protein
LLAETDDSMKDIIRLNNTCEDRPVAYRIRTSVPNLFVLQSSEGVLDPAQKLSIPVVLKAFPSGADGGGDPDASPLAKFAIEFLECDDSYYTAGVKKFWKNIKGSQHCKKILSVAISKARLYDLQKMPLSETALVSPPCIYFNGKTFVDAIYCS